MRLSARSWIPSGALALALLLTGLATYYLVATAELKDRLRFENSVERVQALIEHRMDTYLALLRGGSGLFAAIGPSPRPSRPWHSSQCWR